MNWWSDRELKIGPAHLATSNDTSAKVAALLSQGVDCPCSREKPRSHRRPKFGRKCEDPFAPPCQPSRKRPQIITSHELWPLARLTPLLLLTRPVGQLICQLE